MQTSIPHKSTHSDRLERWLGADEVARLSQSMGKFYYPVPVAGVPGNVFAMPGGDFCGEIRAGQELSAVERAVEILRKEQRNRRLAHARATNQLGAFGSLSALITAATSGKSQPLTFSKTGTSANNTGQSMDLWTRPGMPAAGAAAAAAPAGTTPTKATTGALAFNNPSTANTLHFTLGEPSASVAANTLLLYDRIFSVAKLMNSAVAEVVTGVPTRYQNQVAGTLDYIGGNFVFASIPTTVLPATGHSWTGLYTNQAGSLAQAIPSIAGISACVVAGVDLAVGNWFMPLAAGDIGIKALTQMTASAAILTGTIDWVMGHPLALLPCPIANMVCVKDGINTAFNLQTMFDNACPAFLEINKPSTASTNYNGIITFVSE